LAPEKPWKAKLLLGVVWLLRNVIVDVGDGRARLVEVVLKPVMIVSVEDWAAIIGAWVLQEDQILFLYCREKFNTYLLKVPELIEMPDDESAEPLVFDFDLDDIAVPTTAPTAIAMTTRTITRSMKNILRCSPSILIFSTGFF
jgi:hypothetical protein